MENNISKFSSRKYHGLLFCILTLLAAFSISILTPVASSLYTELVAGLIGIFTIYCGGNVWSKKYILTATNDQSVLKPEEEQK